MNALLTGLRGTVAPVLARALEARGDTVTAWDRERVSPDDPRAGLAFLEQTDPDAIVHLAMGSPEWAALLARFASERGRRFLFTGTVSVYSAGQRGPFAVDDVPEPGDEYGTYKRDCERRIQADVPDALIVRLGWQIGDGPGSNNMVDYLQRTMDEHGEIRASRRWRPACSFLEDTASVLVRALTGNATGLHHLDGNPGLSVHEISVRLNQGHGSRWRIIEAEDPAWDARMVDTMSTPSIVDRLPDRESRAAV